jgi:hypothetical protein
MSRWFQHCYGCVNPRRRRGPKVVSIRMRADFSAGRPVVNPIETGCLVNMDPQLS